MVVSPNKGGTFQKQTIVFQPLFFSGDMLVFGSVEFISEFFVFCSEVGEILFLQTMMQSGKMAIYLKGSNPIGATPMFN